MEGHEKCLTHASSVGALENNPEWNTISTKYKELHLGVRLGEPCVAIQHKPSLAVSSYQWIPVQQLHPPVHRCHRHCVSWRPASFLSMDGRSVY